MTPEQAQEIIDKLNETLTLLREVKGLLEGERIMTPWEWHSDAVKPPYVFEKFNITEAIGQLTG